MAKAPSSKVPKTSGQGVSRLSYKQGYTAAAGKGTRVPTDKVAVSADTNQPKTGKLSMPSKGQDYSKGETPTMGKPPKSSVSLTLQPAKKFKSEKDQSGFLKEKK
jgi:hypothetical protein